MPVFSNFSLPRQKHWRILIGLFAFAVLAYSIRLPVLNGIASVLVHEDELPSTADFIYLLPGEVIARPTRAAEVLRAQRSTRIRIPIIKESRAEIEALNIPMVDAIVQKLSNLGVKPREIEILRKTPSDSTIGDAHALKEALAKEPTPKDVIVVTSWYHTGRAAWAFDRVFKNSGIRFHFAAAYVDESPRRYWWHSEDSTLKIFTEYLKWGYYLVTY